MGRRQGVELQRDGCCEGEGAFTPGEQLGDMQGIVAVAQRRTLDQLVEGIAHVASPDLGCRVLRSDVGLRVGG